MGSPSLEDDVWGRTVTGELGKAMYTKACNSCLVARTNVRDTQDKPWLNMETRNQYNFPWIVSKLTKILFNRVLSSQDPGHPQEQGSGTRLLGLCSQLTCKYQLSYVGLYIYWGYYWGYVLSLYVYIYMPASGLDWLHGINVVQFLAILNVPQCQHNPFILRQLPLDWKKSNYLFLNFRRVENERSILCQTTRYWNCRSSREECNEIWKWNEKNERTTIDIPARCFKGIPASTSAAHDAFIAHGRSYWISWRKFIDTKTAFEADA